MRWNGIRIFSFKGAAMIEVLGEINTSGSIPESMLQLRKEANSKNPNTTFHIESFTRDGWKWFKLIEVKTYNLYIETEKQRLQYLLAGSGAKEVTEAYLYGFINGFHEAHHG
jgi:hypothetical protein